MLILGFFLLEVGFAAYCTAGPTSVQDSNLGAVHLQEIDDRTNCPGQAGVVDLTNLVANLAPGNEYTISWDVSTCGQSYTRASAAWIDFNGNQIFEPTEQIGFHLTTSQNPTETVSVTFTVPTTAQSGTTTRLRVMVVETSSMTIDPCSIYAYGGAKDFSIQFGTPKPPVPVSSAILVLYSDTTCHQNVMTIYGSNETFGSAPTQWGLADLDFRVASGATTASWSITRQAYYSLEIPEDGTYFHLGRGNQGIAWEVSVQGTRWGICTDVATALSDVNMESNGKAIQSFLLVNI